MTYANIRPAAAPALDRLALAGVLALLVGACLLTGCVSKAVNDNARLLTTHLVNLQDISRPLPGSTADEVAGWNAAWAQALSTTAQIVRASE